MVLVMFFDLLFTIDMLLVRGPAAPESLPRFDFSRRRWIRGRLAVWEWILRAD